MIFEQFRDPDLGCLSYLLGDAQDGRALVVDPLERLGSAHYIEQAAAHGLMISEVIDTHLHADHISIGRALAEAAGARYLLSEAADTAFPHEPLAPGAQLRLGSIELTVLATPGHTPESISLLVRDASRSLEPWFVLTGDSLFVGDVARPDLMLAGGQEEAAARARALYQSLHEVLLKLDDTVEIYPGHYGASTCGGPLMSAKTISTIGFERRHNVALQHHDRESFVRFVLEHLKPLPERYQDIKRTNMGQVMHHA